MSTMNGNSYYSPPCRHTRCLGDRFIEASLPERRPDLEEFPFLVAKAIQAGLIKPPVPRPLADWRHITCIKCGQDFTRGQRKYQACTICRLDKKTCTMCGEQFQPSSKKQACCSDIFAGKRPVCRTTLLGRFPSTPAKSVANISLAGCLELGGLRHVQTHVPTYRDHSFTLRSVLLS